MKKYIGLILIVCLQFQYSNLVAQNCNIKLTSAIGSDSQTVCLNSPINNITYSHDSVATNAQIAGLPAGVNFSFVPDYGVIIFGSPTESGTFNFTLTYSVPSCPNSIKKGQIIVTQDVIVNAVSNQVVCAGTNASAINFSSSNSGGTVVYNWTNNNPAIGLSAAGQGNIPSFSATNPGTSPLTANIAVRATQTIGGKSCTGSPMSFSITVNPTPDANLSILNQTICSGSAIIPIESNSDVGGTVFNWIRDSTNALTGIPSSGIGNIYGNLINNRNFVVSDSFTITPSFTYEGVTCYGSGVKAGVLVNPLPIATATPINQTICSGSAINMIQLGSNLNGNVSFAWQRDHIAEVTGIASNGSGDISGSLTNTTNVSQAVNFEIIPTFENGGKSCTGLPVIATVLVKTGPNVLATVQSQTICNDTKIVPISFSSDKAGTVFNWIRDNTDSVKGIASSGSGNIPNAQLTNSTTSLQKVTFTITPVDTTGGRSCTGSTIISTVFVNPTPTAKKLRPGQTICSGNPIMPVEFTSNVEGTIFKWTRNNTDIVTGMPSTGFGNISGSLINSSGGAVRVIFTILPLYIDNNDTCAGTPIYDTVIVGQGPKATASPISQIICSGSDITPVFLSADIGGTIFDWTRNQTDSVSGINSTGSGNISGILTNNSTTPKTVGFTITPKVVNPGQICTGEIIMVTVIVNPVPIAEILPSRKTTCSGYDIDSIRFSSNVAGTIFTWKRDNLNNVTGIPETGSGNIGGQLINTTNKTQTVIFSIIPKLSFGSDSCTGALILDTITVSPKTFIDQVSDYAFCNGSTTPVIEFSPPATTDIKYEWKNLSASTSIGLGSKGSDRIESFSAINSDSIPLVNNIRVVSSFTNNGVSCPGDSTTFSITVNPTVKVNKVNDTLVCNNSKIPTITFSSNATGGAIVYSWVNSNPSNRLGPSGTGDIPTFNPLNTNNTMDTLTITVSPEFMNGGTNCMGLADSFQIVVIPQARVNTVENQVYCNETNTIPIELISPTIGDIKYVWRAELQPGDSAIGLIPTGDGQQNAQPGPIPSFEAKNNTSVTINNIIRVVPYIFVDTLPGCVGRPYDFTIYVNPTPNAKAEPERKAICSNSNFKIGLSGSVSGTIFNWERNNLIAISGTVLSTKDTIIGLLSNLQNRLDSTVFSIKPTYTNEGLTCKGDSIIATVLVNPEPIANATPEIQSSCTATSIDTIKLSSPTVGGSIVYNWTRDPVENVSGIPGPGIGNISGTLANIDSIPRTAIFNIIPTYTNEGINCIGDAIKATVTVNPKPVLNPLKNFTFCNRDNRDSISFSSSSPDSSFTWISDKSVGFGTFGSGFIPPFTATNTSDAPITATITVSVFASINKCYGDPKTFTITVNPSPPKPNFTWPKLNGDNLCSGSENIKFNISEPSSFVNYSWFVDTGTVNIKNRNNPNSVISFSNPGTYKIMVGAKSSIYGCTDTVSQTVIVSNTPGISPRKILLKNPGNLLIYPDNSMDTIKGYQWGYDPIISRSPDSLGIPVDIPGQVYQTFIPDPQFIRDNKLDTTQYAYWVLLRKGDCYSKIYYNGPYAARSAIVLPAEDVPAQVRAFPNPNNGTFSIELKGKIYGKMNMNIFNALGQPVYTSRFTKTAPEVYERLAINHLPSGIYYIEIIGSDLKKVTTKFIIQH